MAANPLHAGYAGPDSLALLAVVSLAAVGSAVLLGLALGAFTRRQSRPYLLIAGALAALLARSAVAGLTATGGVAPGTHHLLEHSLDVVLVALVVAAVYYARETGREVEA